MLLPTTLSLAAAAALINIWISVRCGSMRGKEKIMHGDGGNPAMMRRMRAHSNFIENTPLVLVLIGVIEAAGKGGQWLPIVGALFMLGRVAHPFGMEHEKPHPARMFGAATGMLTQLGLAIVAVLIALGKF